MTEKEFYKTFWINYLQIEEELIETFRFVELSTDNYNTFSSKYLKIFLQIGSEIDICFKEYIRLISANSRCCKIEDYKRELKNNDLNFFNEAVVINNINIMIKPWIDLYKNNYLNWWKAYNKVKHQRADQVTINYITQPSYKFANLQNVVTSLSGLYILLMNIFAKIKSSYDESPVPNSKLFKIESSRWVQCKFFSPIYASIKDGEIYFDNTKSHVF